jgi:predicted metal-dependent hydrolase
LRRYRWLAFKLLEPKMSPPLRLAITAACEHFTATFAHNGLTSDDMAEAHPTMKALLYWHAAEEIEHKSVAFDVFEEVDGRYSMRVAGMVVAIIALSTLWAAGTASFIAQDEDASWKRVVGEIIAARRSGRVGNFEMLDMFKTYIRRDFHPDEVDDYELAQQYLESVGRLHA